MTLKLGDDKMLNEEAKEIIRETMRFNRRLITQLETMNAVYKVVHGITTSYSSSISVTTTVESTATQILSPRKCSTDQHIVTKKELPDSSVNDDIQVRS